MDMAGFGAALVDLDNGGSKDLFVSRGIGAQIKVTTASGTRYNHQTSSVCYASSSLGPLHFGLGPDTVATHVVILWPSGIEQTLENVSADRIVKVVEAAPGK